MAVNKKGKGVNNLFDDDDFGLAELGRLADQNDREPAAFRELRLRARNARGVIQAINTMEEVEPGSTQADLFQKQLRIAQRTKIQLEPRMALYKETQRERLNVQAVNAISREFADSSINSFVTGQMNSQEGQAAGLRAASNSNFVDLSQRRKDIMNEMGGVRQEAMNMAGKYIQNHGVNPSAAQGIRESSDKFKDLARELTQVTAGLSQLKREGLDPQSRMSSLTKAAEGANSVLGFNKLEDQMRSGEGLGSLSARDLKQREAEAAQKLIKTMDDLRNSMGKGEKVVEEFTQKAEAAADELKEIQDVQKMGGGSNAGGGNGTMWVTAIGQLANLIGNTIHVMGVQQPMDVMGNIAGYANLENQKYDMWRAAIGGDMSARMNLGGMDNAAEFGKTLANREGWVAGSRIVGGAAGTVGSGLELAEAASGATVGIAGHVLSGKDDSVHRGIQAAQAMTESLAVGAISAKDVLQKISTSKVEIGANQQARSTTAALNHVSGYQLQQYHDYMMELLPAAGGQGTSAAQFMERTNSASFMSRMEGYGLGTTEFAKLAQQGVAGMGSQFSVEGVLGAKRLENLGFGSAQENMQRQVMMAGAQNPNASMEKIIEQGMSKGLTSSKSLNLIAEHTGQLVEQTVRSGSATDASDIISKMLIGSTNANMPNKDMALQTASHAIQSQEQMITGRSASWTDRVAVARLQKDLGMSWDDANILRGTSTGTWKGWEQALQKGTMNKDQLAAEMFKQGVDVSHNATFQKDPASFMRKFAANKTLDAIEGGSGFAWGANKDWSRVRNWIMKDESGHHGMQWAGAEALTKDVPDFVRVQIDAMNKKIKSSNPNADTTTEKLAILQRGGFGISAFEGKLPNIDGPTDTQFGLAKEEANRKAQQQQRAAQEGRSTLVGDERSGMGAIAATAYTGRNVQDSVADGEHTWATAAAKSAESFGESAIKLNNAGDKLIQAANALMTTAGANRRDTVTDTHIDKFKKELPDQANPRARIDGGSP